jgi:small subunit ribosomal protein S6
MSFYETLYIVDPNLENKSLEKTMNEIGKELEKTKSKIINHRVWGKKRLAYSIERQKYGSYILIQFEGGDQQKMIEYDTWMRLNNSVLRHMTVLLNEKPEIYVEEKNPESEGEENNIKESSDNEQLSDQVDTSDSDNNEDSDNEENESDDDKTTELKEAE